MRYKLLLAATYGLLVSTLLVYADNKLTLYIHPRYVLFTMLAVSAGALILFMSGSLQQPKDDEQPKVYAVLLVAAVSLLALVLPPTSLSDQLAGNRLNSATTQKIETSSLDAFSQDLTRFNIREWHAFLSSNPTPTQISGKKAQIEGFILRQDGHLYLARYQLTCCAVDATPLTVPILADSTTDSFISGSWYNVSGSFSQSPSNDGYVLSVTQYEQIEEPVPAYVY